MKKDSEQTIILFGAGGHARSVIGVLRAEARWQLGGLLDDNPPEEQTEVLGVPILGGQEQLDALRQSGIHKAMVSISNNVIRGKLAEVLRTHGFELITIRHPAACMMTECSVGEGAFLHAMSIIGPACEIGPNVIVQPFTSVGHENRIGECVQFCPGVHVGGCVEIGDYSFFGPGSVIYPGVKIGRHVSVGANSVIHKDVPDHAVLAGNPARQIRAKEAAPESA